MAFVVFMAMPLFSQPLPPFLTVHGDVASFKSFEDDHGGIYVTWIEAPTRSSTSSLHAQHIGVTGEVLWSSTGLTVSTQVASGADWGGLADGQGGLTLYWDEADGIHAQRFRPDGTMRRAGSSVVMSTTTAIQPDAVPDAAGGTLMVWREKIPNEPRYVLKAQRLDENAKPLWSPGGIRVSLQASNQTNPSVVYDNMSGMIVAWRNQVDHSSELRVQRLDFKGNRLWTLQGLLVTAPLGQTDYPQIAPTGTGEVVIAWTGPVKAITQIVLQKVGPQPALKWGSGALATQVTNLENQSWDPVLLGDDAGGAWIGWEDFYNQQNYQVRLNHLDTHGVSAWPNGEMTPSPALGGQGKLAMVHDQIGGVWLAWIDNRLATNSVYAQEVNMDGAPLLTPSGILVANQLTKPSRPQLVPLSPGKAAVLWADQVKKGQWTLSWAPLTAR